MRLKLTISCKLHYHLASALTDSRTIGGLTFGATLTNITGYFSGDLRANPKSDDLAHSAIFDGTHDRGIHGPSSPTSIPIAAAVHVTEICRWRRYPRSYLARGFAPGTVYAPSRTPSHHD